jgi:hypothetical protein
VCCFVVETETVDGIYGVELDAAGINERSEGSDHALAPEFPFVTGAGGKAEQWRPPVAVHDDAEVEAETRGVPAMIFAFHCVRLRNAGRKYASGKRRKQTKLRIGSNWHRAECLAYRTCAEMNRR